MKSISQLSTEADSSLETACNSSVVHCATCSHTWAVKQLGSGLEDIGGCNAHYPLLIGPPEGNDGAVLGMPVSQVLVQASVLCYHPSVTQSVWQDRRGSMHTRTHTHTQRGLCTPPLCAGHTLAGTRGRVGQGGLQTHHLALVQQWKSPLAVERAGALDYPGSITRCM